MKEKESGKGEVSIISSVKTRECQCLWRWWGNCSTMFT